MWDDVLAQLDSSQLGLRMRGWKTLGAQAMQAHLPLTDEQKQDLLERFSEETAPEVLKCANHCLLAISLLQPRDRPKAPDKPAPQNVPPSQSPNLASWFWEPLHERSAVYRGFDATRRRDEDAVIELARALPTREFPSTVFMRIPVSRPDWDLRLQLQPKAVCLVGRLGIFGARAVSAFQDPSTRFFFPTHERPKSLEPGDLDEQFHRIHQRNACNQVLPPFITRQDEGAQQRTDYALVQRYYDEKHDRFIIILAGCSGLGTLGAVDWSTNLGGLEIPLPPGGLDEHDTFEALIEVDAEFTEFPWHWHTRTPRALRVLAGNKNEWYAEEGGWGNRRPDLLRIKRDSQRRAYEVHSESDRNGILFTKGILVNFVDAVFELTKGVPPATIKPQEWKHYKDVLEEVFKPGPYRKRLHGKLHDALSIDEKTRHVTLTVPIQNMT